MVTGVTTFDKLLIKGSLLLLANLAYILVGLLYSYNIIKTRKSGGVAQDIIYIALLIAGWIILYKILNFIKRIIAWWQAIPDSTWYLIMWILIAVTVIFICLIVLQKTVFQKKHSKQPYMYQDNLNSNILTNNSKTDQILNVPDINQRVESSAKAEEYNNDSIDTDYKKKNYTVKELWDMSEVIPIKVTSVLDDNVDWVEIYKDPYRYQKIYGNLKLNRWKYGWNHEIFNAEKKVWKLY